jgi:hypothetical protein
MKLLGKVFLTPEEGARTAVYLAADSSVSDISGEYYYKCRIWPTTPRGRDMEVARRLFELSESISSLTFNKSVAQYKDV